MRSPPRNLIEPPLDLTVKSEPQHWAERDVRPRASQPEACAFCPRAASKRSPVLTQGAWWVQDAAASLPAHLMGDVAGKRVADLCAAPGGKTAQLALAGASVVAVDISKTRLKTLSANLARLGLAATTVAADAATWSPDERFDAVLLDAPCSSTGTIRRHPDIPYLKSPKDIDDAGRPPGAAPRQCRLAAQARRHARLFHLLARARGRRGPDCRAACPELEHSGRPDPAR